MTPGIFRKPNSADTFPGKIERNFNVHEFEIFHGNWTFGTQRLLENSRTLQFFFCAFEPLEPQRDFFRVSRFFRGFFPFSNFYLPTLDK